MLIYERACQWMGRLKLSRVLMFISVILLTTVPLFTQYYISKYETFEALEDISSLNAAELKLRIKEVIRLKPSIIIVASVSMSIELRELEAKRTRLKSEVAAASYRADNAKAELARAASELQRLRVSADQARLAQLEAIRRDTPELAAPLPILPTKPPSTLPQINPSSVSHCRMFSRFDHSRCSLTSGFPVYLYDPDIYAPLAGAEMDGFLKTTLRQTFGYNLHLTQDPNEACMYLVIVGEAFPSEKSAVSVTESYKLHLNETALKSLPFWGGDGRNHLLVNLARRDLSVGSGDAFIGASTGRAMVAQSTFTHDRFRPGFDLITLPALGPPGGDVWSDCGLMAPARRQYLLSFQGSQPPLSETAKDHGDMLIGKLQKMVTEAPQSDLFMLQFECDPPVERRAVLPAGDWALCGTDRSRKAILHSSTFALILAPADVTYTSTALLQARLYEALRSGAIPVILGGDRIRLPFDEVLDWRRAVISLPTARVTELHFLLRALGDADLLVLRRQGRVLWERYLSSVQASVDSILATIRQRLLIPPRPAPAVVAPAGFDDTFTPPHLEPTAVDSDPEETLGSLETPYASPSYRRNYSVGLIHGYEAWNEWGEPFALFPQLPWDPPVTSEARFTGSAAGFRPVGAGAGGAGREFSEALGGDRPREQFTVVILSYERESVLATAIARLRSLPYLNKYETPSASVGSSPLRHTLEALGDISSLNAAELKLRIEEMLRIKASVSTELRELEAKRARLQREAAAASYRADNAKAEHARAASELQRLRVSADQARLAQLEAIRRDTPELAAPLPILPTKPPFTLPQINPSSVSHCRMFSCFDHSRCSLTSGFPVYLYDPDIYAPLAGAEVDGFLKTTLRQTFGYNLHLTQDPNEACMYLVIVGEAFPSEKSAISVTESYKLHLNETALKSLPFWGGDGRNHLLINLARRDLSVGSGDAFIGASTGRAMVAQSTFTHDRFRPGFDLITPPALGPPGGDVWSDCGLMAPARRQYLLSFQGLQPPLSETAKDHGDVLIGKLQKMVTEAPQSDLFMLQFECDPPVERRAVLPAGDWALCGTDRSRKAILHSSTFALILAPADVTYTSTALLQARLYEALRSGAIPVILGGDRIRLPFDEVLDWRRAVISLPTARVTELHFLLRALGDADLLVLRRQGRVLWERYLSSVQASVDSILATIRQRLLIPPRPAPAVVAPAGFDDTFTPPHLEPPAVDSDPEETLGPLEAPYASPSYRRNYSVGLIHGYEAWNEWGEPFALFPQLPWDPPVTSEARFTGSAAGFRPVGAGAGGAGREFSEALGGDRPREQFTVVILSYERESVLATAIARLRSLPYLNKVIVVWNGPSPPSSMTSWPESGAPVAVIRAARNSLNNRFLPYHLIDTEAVLCVDDDVHLRHDEIVFAFRVWREHRDRIVGFPGRYHAWDLNFNNGFLYNSNYSCELSMVLTGAAFVHRYYMWAYWRTLPAAIRDYVDEFMNCEDIAMNFLVAHITRRPPVKVTSRWCFPCLGCSTTVSLSSDMMHWQERHKCIQFFSQVMGYTPLLTTQYRADSVLFKTALPHDKQKCFKFI